MITSNFGAQPGRELKQQSKASSVALDGPGIWRQQTFPVTLAPEAFSASGFNPTRHAAPYTAISRYAHGEIYLITTPVSGGWVYRIDYPYYSWAETIVRKKIQRRDLTSLLSQLNELENESNGQCKFDTSEMTSAVKFLNSEGMPAASAIEPDAVSRILNAAAVKQTAPRAVRDASQMLSMLIVNLKFGI
jgi:hypothetical protein